MKNSSHRRALPALIATATLLLLLTAAPRPAHAQDLFSIDAFATSGTPLAVTFSDENLPDLVESAIEASGVFAAFNGRDTQIEVDYANLPNAIVVNVNAAATSATLAIPGIGFSQTFTGVSRDNLQEQIENFLFESGSTVYADFLELVRRQTLISVLDGNPASATAVLARSAVERHTLSRLGGGRDYETDGSWFRAAASVSGSDITGFSATRGELDLAGGVLYSDLIGLTFGTIISIQNIEGSQFVNGGFEIGIPITPFGPGDGFTLIITPLFQLGYGASIDAADAGLFSSFGANATVVFRFDAFEFALGAQILASNGIDIEIDDGDEDTFEFDGQLTQQVASLGAAVRVNLPASLALEAGVSYNHFIEDVATDGFFSPSLKLVIGPEGGGHLKIGYRGDFADGFNSNGGSIELNIPF